MRSLIIRSFVLLGLVFPSLASADTVVEFYNTNLDNYFITANSSEAAAIDNGSAGPGWIRTGYTFNSGGSTPVCRFYGSQSPGPNSHFYTLAGSECDGLKQLQASTPATQKRWNFESLDFISTPPTTVGVNGSCPTGTTPVYRAYNNGFTRGIDSNHRITTSMTAIQEVVNRGWSNEGVVMCAQSSAVNTNAGLSCTGGKGAGTNGISLYTPNNYFTYQLSTATANAPDIATLGWGAAYIGAPLGAYTGSLKADLWAVSSSYSGGTLYGYTLGTFVPSFSGPGAHSSTQINSGGYSTNTIVSSVSGYNPPSGQYCLVITLSQYSPSMCTPNPMGYCIVDWLQFNGAVTFH